MAGKIFFGHWNRKRQMGEQCDFPGILRIAKAAPPAAMQLMRTDATPEPADTTPIFSPLAIGAWLRYAMLGVTRTRPLNQKQ